MAWKISTLLLVDFNKGLICFINSSITNFEYKGNKKYLYPMMNYPKWIVVIYENHKMKTKTTKS